MTPSMCQVWWAATGDASLELLDLLDSAERERHGRFRAAADRDRYLVAHALARLAVAREAGCAPQDVVFTLHCRACEGRPDPRPDPHGKPRPAGAAAGLEISISHSGERVLLALTRGAAVGADVEQVSAARDTEGLVDYCLTPAERRALAALPAEQRTEGFFGYWARKEALLKATGEGLSGGLQTVGVSGPFTTAEVRNWDSPEAPEQAWLSDLDAGPGYRAALAALSPVALIPETRDAAPLLADYRAADSPRRP